jgi:hypothetical protein
MTKTGRNDPCPCGSGKKYKKCCEEKESAPKKLVAHKLESSAASNITGLFQKMSFPQPTRLPETPVETESSTEKPLIEVTEEPKKEEPKEDSEPPAEDPSEKT